ncbi:MAG TPA: DUF4190 domain-containing protein [Thermoleophilaceae bacterium]
MTTETFGRPESPAQFGGGYAQQQQQGVRTNSKSAWALGLGVVGIPTAFFVFPPLVFSTLAIILGAMGRNEARQDPARGGEQMGTTAIVLGVVGFVIAVAWVVVAGTVL